MSIVPTYQQHYSIPQALGANVKLLFLKEKNNWLPDLEELFMTMSSKTKLLCLNNPNNPTGAVIPDEMLKEIVEIANKYNIWILSDEVYRGLNLYGNPYSLSIADIYEKGISVGSMSKTYSLPGLRVGWITAREDLINEINHQRQYNTISISIIDDYFASLALETKNSIAYRNFDIMRKGLTVLEEWIASEIYADCILPRGGTTALIRYKKDIPSRDFARNLQRSTGVAVLPGETLEMEGYFRLGFCTDALSPALSLISEFIREL
ncbi:aminotransferase class I/II-fold pyridoxal phosphate-dependent enzyme [bacterium]|nr:aminotransferase class I/II-fold pyridoxal phosphate-dependent enzyme [bacterium]